jgi:hypothetical protein
MVTTGWWWDGQCKRHKAESDEQLCEHFDDLIGFAWLNSRMKLMKSFKNRKPFIPEDFRLETHRQNIKSQFNLIKFLAFIFNRLRMCECFLSIKPHDKISELSTLQ